MHAIFIEVTDRHRDVIIISKGIGDIKIGYVYVFDYILLCKGMDLDPL